MFKFDNQRVIGSLIVLFIFFVVFVSSIGRYVQGYRETISELQLDNRDLRYLRERADLLGFEIRELENEIYELRTENAVLNDQINQINANKEAEKYLNPSKEVGE